MKYLPQLQLMGWLLALVFTCLAEISEAQVVASFESADTVCVGEELHLTNTSSAEAQMHHWRFCALELGTVPQPESLGSFGLIDAPAFVTVVEEDGLYYGFVTNYNNHALIRLDFGESLNNTPQAVNVGSFPGIVHTALEGISVHRDEGQWWGFAVTGYGTNPSLIRYSFGASIANIPEAETLGNVGGMNFPHELLIFEEGGEWWGWTINFFGSTLTRFSFGNSLANTPVGINVGNIGELYIPTGFTTFQQDGEWHMIVCNEQSFSRLDFGASLSNIPTGVNLGVDTTFESIRDILIYATCEEIFGLALDGKASSIALLDFQNDIYNNPSYVLLPNVEAIDAPISFTNLIRSEEGAFFLITNAGDNTVLRVEVPSCDIVTPLIAMVENPSPVIYQEAGDYVIELVVDEGLGSEARFCKRIVVADVEIDVGQDSMLCVGDSLHLDAGFDNAIWQDGTIDSSLVVTKTGWYIAQVDTFACHLRDSVHVEFANCQKCLVFPNAFTPDGDGINDGFSVLNHCPTDPTEFEMKIYNRWGEKVFHINDITFAWDGRYEKKAVPPGVYVWVVRYAYPDLEAGSILEFVETGHLNLLR